MARRRKNPAPENKDAVAPPENKDDGILESLVEAEAQLDKLLKAEGRFWIGEIGARQLHESAEEVRRSRRGRTDG